MARRIVYINPGDQVDIRVVQSAALPRTKAGWEDQTPTFRESAVLTHVGYRHFDYTDASLRIAAAATASAAKTTGRSPLEFHLRVARLLAELHGDETLSEQQCAKIFGVDLPSWREIEHTFSLGAGWVEPGDDEVTVGPSGLTTEDAVRVALQIGPNDPVGASVDGSERAEKVADGRRRASDLSEASDTGQMDDTLKTLMRLEAEATKGPWTYQEKSDAYTHILRSPHAVGTYVVNFPQGSKGKSEADARFVAAMRNATPWLLSALARFSREVTVADAEELGANGAPHSEFERALYEGYMRGHCWEVGEWLPAKEQYADLSSRMTFAVWRDCAALGLRNRIDLESIPTYIIRMAAITSAASGRWNPVDAIRPEHETPALRYVAALWRKYARSMQIIRDLRGEISELREGMSKPEGLSNAVLGAFAPLRPEQALSAAAGTAEMFYLQDSRSYVGNCPLWWAEHGRDYTTRIDRAQKYTLEHALALHKLRGTDVPWPCSQIDTLLRPTIDVQDLGHVAKQIERFKVLCNAARSVTEQKK
jgi:hypothetical protein